MPIFEYQCPAGHVSEVIDISNKARVPTITCACGATAARIPSVVSWTLGSGAKDSESPMSRAITRARQAERDSH